MRTNCQKLAVIACAVLLAATPLAAATNATTCADTAESEPPFPHLAKSLGLNEDQARRLRRIFQETRPQLAQLHQERINLRRELEQLFATAQLDEAAIKKTAEDLAKVHAEITRQQAQLRLAVRKELTPEQAARWRKLRQSIPQNTASEFQKNRFPRRQSNRHSLPPSDE